MNYNEAGKLPLDYIDRESCLSVINHYLLVKSERESNILIHRKAVEKEYKLRLVFHGGCLGCITPLVCSIGVCSNCMFYQFDQEKPNLRIGS